MDIGMKVTHMETINSCMVLASEKMDVAIASLNDLVPEISNELSQQVLRDLRDRISDALETVNEVRIESNTIAGTWWGQPVQGFIE